MRGTLKVKLEISSDQRMTLYGEDFDFSTEANDRIGIDYSGAKPSRAVTITPDDPLYQGEEITMLLMPMMVNE